MRVRYRGYVDRGNSRKWMCNDWTVKKGDGQMGDSQTVKMVDGYTGDSGTIKMG